MTLWHASTELTLTTAAAAVAKTVYLAGRHVSGRGSELDTSG